jgi:hypothetical protein
MKIKVRFMKEYSGIITINEEDPNILDSYGLVPGEAVEDDLLDSLQDEIRTETEDFIEGYQDDLDVEVLEVELQVVT